MGEDHAQEAQGSPREQHEIEPPSGFFLCGILSYTPSDQAGESPQYRAQQRHKTQKATGCIFLYQISHRRKLTLMTVEFLHLYRRKLTLIP